MGHHGELVNLSEVVRFALHEVSSRHDEEVAARFLYWSQNQA
jgi:Arc/MetJ-type ribon-helix-helix transcriptional regulator